MNFDEFIIKASEYLTDILDDVTVSRIDVTKNNGLILTGLQFAKEGNNIAPTIYMHEFYHEIEKGENFFRVCDNIIEAYMKAGEKTIGNLDFFEKYEGVKDILFCKVINYDKNRDLLKSVPHVECMDLAIVFYVLIGMEEYSGSILVKNEHAERWGVEIGQIYKDAVCNNITKMESRVYSIEDVLLEMLGKRNDEEASMIIESIENCKNENGIASMYVLTNSEKYYGAACILDEQFMADFADKINSDFYILPSSIHELILVPESVGTNPEELKNMVLSVNESQVAVEERLSDNIYRFSRLFGKVIPV